MNQSFRIGSVRGITVRVHKMAVWLLAGVLLYSLLSGSEGRGFGETLVTITMLIVLVFLHEMGHCVAAQRFGIRVIDITFWPMGGMARMSEIPENSRIEGLIAIAGPAVNFVLFFLAVAVWVVVGLPDPSSSVFAKGLLVFGVMNLMLGAFNLLPAFPMDGGRVLRAWLGRNGDWVGATEKAVRVGRVIAWLFVFPGVLWSYALPLIGVFVWLVGARELMGVRLRHGISPFGRFAPQADGFAGTTFEAASPARPSSDSGMSNGGFSDSDIAELENYRGRLKRPTGE